MTERKPTNKPLPEALRALMTEQGVSFRALAQRLEAIDGDAGHSYGYLNKLARGDYKPKRGQTIGKQIEALAKALGVRPEHFAEYRLWKTQRRFDPAEVGLDTALRNLRDLG